MRLMTLKLKWMMMMIMLIIIRYSQAMKLKQVSKILIKERKTRKLMRTK